MKAQIHEKLQRFGVTGPGREWLLRALHPASEDRCPGLPDQSSNAVLRPDFRMQATIHPPNAASAWDCIIWTPPGDVNAVYWATGPTGVDFTTQTAPAGCEVGALRLQRSTQSSLTSPFTNIADGSVQDLYTQEGAIASAGFRHMFKSITVHLIAAAVSDQGQVYAAQFAPQFRRPGMIVPNGYDSGVPDPVHPGENFGLYGELYQTVLPASETALCAMAPAFYMGEAREGCYIPLRLSGPSQPFAHATSHSTAVLERGGVSYSSDTTYFTNGAFFSATPAPLKSGTVSIPWPFRCTSTNSQLGPASTFVAIPEGASMDTGYDNMNIGVAIFRGLQGGSGGGFSSALQLKCIAGLEIAPAPETSDRVFTEEAAAYDPKALQAYYTLALELRGAYPARYNSLGDIWDAIKSAASSVWDVFKPAVQAAAPAIVEQGMRALAGGAALTGARPGARRVLYAAPPPARSPSTRSVRLTKTTPKKTRRRKLGMS